MKKLITIRLELEEDVHRECLRQYIADALLSWSGCYPPESAMFHNIKDNSVKVRIANVRRRKLKSKLNPNDKPLS